MQVGRNLVGIIDEEVVVDDDICIDVVIDNRIWRCLILGLLRIVCAEIYDLWNILDGLL